MKYKVIELKPFKLLVVKEKFAINAVTNKIPNFWDEQIEEGVLKQLKELACEPGIYGSCGNVDLSSSTFEYGIGVKVKENIKITGFDLWEMDHLLWAVFECVNIDHIAEIWDSVFNDLFINSDYERVEGLAFEYYQENSGALFCELSIPIKKVK